MSKGELVKDLQRSLKDQFKLSSTAGPSTAGPSRTTDSRLATSSSSTAISIPTASLTPESPTRSRHLVDASSSRDPREETVDARSKYRVLNTPEPKADTLDASTQGLID